MTSTVANIHGSNLVRLTIEQFGSNRAQCVLTQELLNSTATYDVVLESLYISSDIPIFPADTEVFRIVSTIGANIDEEPDLDVHVGICKIGPVYNWLDFAYQIQAFLEQGGWSRGGVYGSLNVEGALLAQKTIAFRGDADFWEDKFLYFTRNAPGV